MMKKDIILCGVGGQGILTIAYYLDNTAAGLGYRFKQCEVHGMSQRGGAVQSHVRISDQPIYSDLIPKGQADMILSVEPLETLRYLDYLSSEGIVITNTVPFVNIVDYPEESLISDSLRHVPNLIQVDAESIAKKTGNIRTQNTVMTGIAVPFLGLPPEEIKKHITTLFAAKGEKIIEVNLKAFDLGYDFGQKHKGKSKKK